MAKYLHTKSEPYYSKVYATREQAAKAAQKGKKAYGKPLKQHTNGGFMRIFAKKVKYPRVGWMAYVEYGVLKNHP